MLSGQKIICLAISDENAGSDVAGLTCTAKLSECGKFYIVNGTKKWITNGNFADYFVTAVRTGEAGILGISMLLIERSEGKLIGVIGLTTKLIKTSYSASGGTAFVTFLNVKVPVENLLGVENRGFEIIMSNFNHERWYIVCCL
ncbi:MAG: acyl-CoA dehydrogenase family protein [bacterium]